MRVNTIVLNKEIGINAFQALMYTVSKLAKAEMEWQTPLRPNNNTGTWSAKRSCVFRREGTSGPCVVDFDHDFYTENLYQKKYEECKYDHIFICGPNDAAESSIWIEPYIKEAIVKSDLSISREFPELECINRIWIEEVPDGLVVENDKMVCREALWLWDMHRAGDITTYPIFFVCEKGKDPITQCGFICRVFEDGITGDLLGQRHEKFPWLTENVKWKKEMMSKALDKVTSFLASYPHDDSLLAPGSRYYLGMGYTQYMRASAHQLGVDIKRSDIPGPKSNKGGKK